MQKSKHALKFNLEQLEDRQLLSFAAPLTFPVTFTPQSVVVADLTNNGNLDILTPAFSSGVSVLLGNGHGGFVAAPGSPFPTGSEANAVAVGDFNGDGKLDLAVACGVGTGSVSLLMGNDNGTFRAPVSYSTGGVSSPYSIVVGDFNGDGKLDLAVADFGSHGVSVLMGNGDGTFQPPVEYSTPALASSMAAAELTGDGKLDLVIANSYSRNVSVLLNKGDGTFKPAENIALPGATLSVAVGDFNRDGRLDLITANAYDNTVSVLLGNGDGTFQAPITSSAGGYATGVAVADFNGDGRLDAVVANGGNTVSVLLGNGAGGFGAHQTIPSGGKSPDSVAVGDFNGDGRPDVVAANFDSHTVGVLLNEAVNINTSYVTQLYFDMLSRQPDPGGLAFFTGLLDQHLSNRAQVVLDIEQSVEFRTDQINMAYEKYLERPVDPSGLQTGLYMLANFGMESELEFIASSPEFLRIEGGGTIDGWLSAVYADALGREADPAGRAAFDFELNNGLINLRQAAHIIFTSQEYDRDIIDQYYLAFLLRNPDPGGAAAWLSEMLAGLSVEQLVVGIASSVEYFQFAATA
jgi:hypothetical protein